MNEEMGGNTGCVLLTEAVDVGLLGVPELEHKEATELVEAAGVELLRVAGLLRAEIRGVEPLKLEYKGREVVKREVVDEDDAELVLAFEDSGKVGADEDNTEASDAS
jgi:hypothetical protein